MKREQKYSHDQKIFLHEAVKRRKIHFDDIFHKSPPMDLMKEKMHFTTQPISDGSAQMCSNEGTSNNGSNFSTLPSGGTSINSLVSEISGQSFSKYKLIKEMGAGNFVNLITGKGVTIKIIDKTKPNSSALQKSFILQSELNKNRLHSTEYSEKDERNHKVFERLKMDFENRRKEKIMKHYESIIGELVPFMTEFQDAVQQYEKTSGNLICNNFGDWNGFSNTNYDNVINAVSMSVNKSICDIKCGISDFLDSWNTKIKEQFKSKASFPKPVKVSGESCLRDLLSGASHMAQNDKEQRLSVLSNISNVGQTCISQKDRKNAKNSIIPDESKMYIRMDNNDKQQAMDSMNVAKPCPIRGVTIRKSYEDGSSVQYRSVTNIIAEHPEIIVTTNGLFCIPCKQQFGFRARNGVNHIKRHCLTTKHICRLEIQEKQKGYTEATKHEILLQWFLADKIALPVLDRKTFRQFADVCLNFKPKSSKFYKTKVLPCLLERANTSKNGPMNQPLFIPEVTAMPDCQQPKTNNQRN